MIRRVGISAIAAALILIPTTPVFADNDAVATDPAGEEFIDESLIPAGDGGNEEFAEVSEEPMTKQMRIRIETMHAFGSESSTDLRGFEESLYQGKWFMPKKEDIRRCISKREASFNYEAVSAGGLYRGAYQFSSRLARGAAWMMQKEVKDEMGEDGVELVKELRKKPINQWNRYWQDRAFWTIWRNGNGKHHWRGGAHSC